MISQAGIYKIKLYENKDFSFSYNEDGTIDKDSINNINGNVIELNTNENYGEYSNAINPAENNDIKNKHLIKFQLNGYNQQSLFTIEKIQTSIYGWIPVLEIMDNQVYLINEPFKQKVNPLNSQVTHTFFIELEPIIPTLKSLEKITIPEMSVTGVLDFPNASNAYIEFASIPDLTGDKIVKFWLYFKDISAPTLSNHIINFSSNSSDHFSVYVQGGTANLNISVNTSAAVNFEIPLSELGANTFNYFEVDKSAGVINRVTINGNIYFANEMASFTTFGAKLIGARNSASDFFKIGYIWGLSATGFEADGQPEGNTNEAWSQSISATVNNSPNTIDLP